MVVRDSIYGCPGQISRHYTAIRRTPHISVLDGGTVSLLHRGAFGKGSRRRGEDSILSRTLRTQHANRRLQCSAHSPPRRCTGTQRLSPIRVSGGHALTRGFVLGFNRVAGGVPVRQLSPARPQRGAGSLPARQWMEPPAAHGLALCAEPRGPTGC